VGGLAVVVIDDVPLAPLSLSCHLVKTAFVIAASVGAVLYGQ
jgi:hypothetical protein